MKKRAVLISVFLFFYANISSIPSTQYNISQEELNKILSNTENYCKRLKEAAFQFTCKETITETFETKEFFKKYRKPGYSFKSSDTKNKYVNDYRIIKEGEKIIEDRTPFLHNGKSVVGEKPELKTAIKSFKSSLAPYYLFVGENKKKFNYRFRKKEKVEKRTAYVVQVDLIKEYDETTLFAFVWIDDSDFSILKFRAFPQSIEGYNNLKNSREYNIGNIEIQDIHYFDYKKKGLRFPSKTEIFLTYTYDSPGKFAQEFDLKAGARMWKKIEATFEYKTYIFFNITVAEPVFH